MRKQEIKINGSVFVETDRLILRMIQETDKEKYVTLSYENSIMKSFFKDEQFIDDLWSTFMKENSFVCSISDKETKEFISTPSEATSTNTINVSDEKSYGDFLEKIVNEIKNKPYKWTGIVSSVVLLLILLLCVKSKKRKKSRKEVTIEEVEDADSLDE